MLLFDKVWVCIENLEMIKQKKWFITRFTTILLFALMIPVGYIACLMATEEELYSWYGI